MTDPITTQLKQASEGLLFGSETDAPFEVIHWQAQGELTPTKLLQLTNHPANTTLEIVTIDKFFAIATRTEDWHDNEEKKTVRKFQQLVSVLKQSLSQIQVWKVGTRTIDVYIVGVTPSNDWVGLATKMVET